jgi:hypothetical protein
MNAVRRAAPKKPKDGPVMAEASRPAVPMLDAAAVNARLLEGRQLSIAEFGGEVVRCTVVALDEHVPPEIFDDYLARGLIQEMEHSYRFCVSHEGRRKLR